LLACLCHIKSGEMEPAAFTFTRHALPLKYPSRTGNTY
jgi:hypothetical protein